MAFGIIGGPLQATHIGCGSAASSDSHWPLGWGWYEGFGSCWGLDCLLRCRSHAPLPDLQTLALDSVFWGFHVRFVLRLSRILWTLELLTSTSQVDRRVNSRTQKFCGMPASKKNWSPPKRKTFFYCTKELEGHIHWPICFSYKMRMSICQIHVPEQKSISIEFKNLLFQVTYGFDGWGCPNV